MTGSPFNEVPLISSVSRPRPEVGFGDPVEGKGSARVFGDLFDGDRGGLLDGEEGAFLEGD